MKVSVVTINRQPSYLLELLDSISAADFDQLSLTFCVGDRDCSHIPEQVPGDLRQVRMLPNAVRENHGSHVDSVVNHAMAVLESSVILEDDVVVSPRFCELLRPAVEEAYRLRPTGHFVLALSSDQVWPRGGAIVPYPLDVYSGTMGMFVPSELQFDLFRFMICHLEAEFVSPDCTIAEYCQTRGIPLYCITQSIVKHIGVQSAISDRVVTVQCPTFAGVKE
jgi:hypothetical protein